MLTLGVTTSTRRGSVAILEGSKVLARQEYEAADGHAERLFASLDAALAAAGASKRDLGLIACDIGPGSFTGVRVGVAAMQGAARALAVPLVGVTSLDAMAAAARSLGIERALAILDAKKSEVFYALYAPELVLGPAHLALADIASLVAAGAEHSATAIGEYAGTALGSEGVRHASTDLPDAAFIALVALDRPRPPQGGVLEPLYVRAPDAKPAPRE